MGSNPLKNNYRLKIIVTSSTYPRWQGDRVPMFIHDQLVFFKKCCPNIEITLLTPHHDGAMYYENTEHGDVFRFKYFYPSRFQHLAYPAIMANLDRNKLLYLQIPFLFIFEFFALLGLVIKRKPDYIYSHWFIPQGIVGGLVGILTGTRHVYTSHSSDVMIAAKLPLIGPFLVRYLTKRAQKITVVSKRSYDKLKNFFSSEQWKLLEQKICIIPMGIDISAFKKSSIPKEELKAGLGYSGRSILLFIGRIVEKKGIKYILEALKEYKNIDPSVLLVVAGDGPSMSELKEIVKNQQLENFVDIIGHTTGNGKLELFNICDVLLLPSIITEGGDAEGLPVVLMEGLASGKICIATDVSGADDVLEDGVNGFLIEQKSGKAILDALLRVHGLSREQKEIIMKNALQTSKMFDWNNIIKRHVDHLFNQ